ncbi:MAG: DUF5691 domain-containing protein [Jatrophihabitans sp.]|uniref:DUF5691 domain-containing protein n=1 Tax=Jatrophihabitans sp. TaxID=1932789 RepID=UPI00390E1CD8
MTTTYDDLVTAATVGIAQRPIAVTDLAGPAGAHADVLDPDPAAAVLDAAALLDVARRAGGLAAAPVALPAPAPADNAPELSRAAGALLRDVLYRRTDRELAAQLLAAAAAAGRIAPAPLLPELLELATRDGALRASVAALLGERGRWLAGLRTEWLRVADAQAPASEDPDVWDTGRLPERLAWLTELRRRDPAAARDQLVAGWARETGDDRVQLLGALRSGLGPADELFLEAALDDRKAEVRQRAARLLAALPGSAFAARAAERADTVLRLERSGLRRRITVSLPDPLDAVAQRDGLRTASPYASVGDRAWHLVQIVAAAPLSLWTQSLRADPDTLADLEIDGGFGAEVHAGWRLATQRERDPAWAAALLGTRHPGYRAAFTAPDEQLVGLLPPPARVARAIDLLRDPRTSPTTAAAVLACPAPWPAALTDALLTHLAAQLRAAEPSLPGSLPQVLGRSIDVTDAREIPATLRELADRFRARTASAPGAGRWPAPLERAADVLDLRHRFFRELQ